MPNPYTTPLVVAVADGAQILNTTTETAIIPAYGFSANDPRIYQGASFTERCWFDISNVVTTPGTVTFRVKHGTTVLASSGAIAMDTTARSNFSGRIEYDLTVRSIGSAGSAFCQGLVILGNVPVGAAADPQGLYFMGSAGEQVPAVVGSLDFTAAWNLSVTAQFSVATATTQLTNHLRILKANST